MQTIANGKVTLTMPESFQELTKEDMKAITGKISNTDWACRNTELHLIYNVTWKSVPFFSFGVDLSKVMQNTEVKLKKANPSLEKIKDLTGVIGKSQFFGIRYSYTTQGIDMIGEYRLIKHDKLYISFICIGRKETFDEYHSIYENMLDTVQLL